MFDGGHVRPHHSHVKILLIVDGNDIATDAVVTALVEHTDVVLYDPQLKPSPDMLIVGRPLVPKPLPNAPNALARLIPVIVVVSSGATLSASASLLLARAVQQYFAPAVIVLSEPPTPSDQSVIASALALPPLSLSPYMLSFAAHRGDTNPPSLAALIAPLVTAAPTRGKLIVIEGADGSGKQTQTALALARLRDAGRAAASVDYPHDAAFCGSLVRSLLAGDHGALSEVDPVLFSSVYAVNRMATAVALRWVVHRGVTVVCDRYATANFAHQGAKVADTAAREALIARLARWEFGVLGLPLPDAVVYLDLPPAAAAVALAKDLAEGVRDTLDIHETAGSTYKEGVRSAFLWCSARYGWTTVRCVGEGGVRIGRAEVAAAVAAVVDSVGV